MQSDGQIYALCVVDVVGRDGGGGELIEAKWRLRQFV